MEARFCRDFEEPAGNDYAAMLTEQNEKVFETNLVDSDSDLRIKRHSYLNEKCYVFCQP